MPIEQMEVTITRPLEEAIRIVPGLEDVRSTTSRGSAEINLFFDWNVNMLETLQLVDAAVSRVQSSLPSTAQIDPTHVVSISPASRSSATATSTSGTVSQTDLWELATYDIKPRLNSLPGVASVLVQGGQRPEYHVTVDPAQMLPDGHIARRRAGRHQPHQRHRFARAAQPQPSALPRTRHRPRSTASRRHSATSS